MTINGNALIREILELCQFKTDDQSPQNEGGRCIDCNEIKDECSCAEEKVHYCDLTGVPL